MHVASEKLLPTVLAFGLESVPQAGAPGLGPGSPY